MPETVSVRKVNGLPRASFSRNLAVQALPLAMCLAPPPAFRDFHPIEFAHAERTKNKPPRDATSRRFYFDLNEQAEIMKVILTKHLWKFFMFLFSKETPLNVQGVMASWGCALLVLAGAVGFACFLGISLYKYFIGV